MNGELDIFQKIKQKINKIIIRQPALTDAQKGHISQRIEEIKEKVKTLIICQQPPLADPAQKELALLINLLSDLERKSDTISLIENVDVAITALFSEKPNIKLATEMRRDIENRVIPVPFHLNMLRTIWHNRSPPAFVIFGSVCLLFLAIPLMVFFLRKFVGRDMILGINPGMIFLIVFAGALGGAISIMIRIQDFSPSTNVDKWVLFFMGFFKPVVGASFALFIFTMIKGGLIPVVIEDTGKELYFFLALSFVSGFSERFAQDIVKETEQKFVGVQ